LARSVTGPDFAYSGMDYFTPAAARAFSRCP
jgi:hypothetical protein